MTSAVVFAYSEVGVRGVRELLAQGVDIPLLFTHADDPKESQWFGSVRQLAQDHGLKVVTPESPNTPEWIAQGAALEPDFVFSFYYRHMLDKAWLSLPRLGALNMHGSLLPKYRGRAPVHWAIIHGETTTGASLHYMVEKPDAGALVDQEAVPILENDTALEVSLKVADAAQTVIAPQPAALARRHGGIPSLGPEARDPISAAAPPRTDASIGARVRAPFTIWCVRSRRLSPAPLPRSTGVGWRCLRRGWIRIPRPIRPKRPCLYAADGIWYADCVDGRRLKILQLSVNGEMVQQNSVPRALSQQPIALA